MPILNNVVPKVIPKFRVPSSCADPVQESTASSALLRSNPLPTFASNVAGALHWHEFGFHSIPTVPTAKRTVVSWDEWLNDLSLKKIGQHWTKNPDHEVGFIVGDEFIVLDADSPESIAALAAIEKAHGATPNMVVKTTKGEHHFFKRAQGTFAKSDSHSTKEFPDRLDVKTGRALIILPPSTGKALIVNEAKNASELTEVNQDFIDAIFQHNGRPVPRPCEIAPSACDGSNLPGNNSDRLKMLLAQIDPDAGGYANWLHILMAIYHETGGSEEGFELANSWSGRGKSYAGEKDIRTKWNSFKSGTANPITIATIVKMAKDNGADMSAIYAASDEQFDPCVTEVVYPNATPSSAPVVLENSVVVDADKQLALVNPFDQYSLRGMSDEMEKNVVAAKPLLDEIALMGQVTVYFAKGNVGKTVITFKLLLDAIRAGRVDPNAVYYLNMDDTATGLVEKNRIAEEYGFNMLAEGHLEFSAAIFKSKVRELIENDQAKGIVLILDTLKKFVNLMDKNQTSAFTNVIRPFVSKGGTVIALAHTNKNPDKNGNPVYGGVSDIMNDIDCAYTIAEVSAENGVKVVEFVNVKRRGHVVYNASYSYCYGNNVSYHELLASVQSVDDTQLDSLKLVEAIKSDAEVIEAVSACISEGINTKMQLADAAAKRANISKRSAQQVIEKYTGNDPALHRWYFSRGARGVQVFVVLSETPPVDAALVTPSVDVRLVTTSSESLTI